MATSPRKQREVEQREEMLLDVARTLLLEDGLKGLTMERLAAATEYSKGTIYQHFRSKDDVVAGLAVRNMRGRIRMFERAAALPGRPRERMTAVGLAEEVFAALQPEEYQAMMLLTCQPIQGVAAADHCAAMDALDAQAKGVTSGIVRDAVAAGDLELPPDTSPDGLTLALWGLSIGTHKLILSHLGATPACSVFGDLHPSLNLRRNCQLLLDGYGWRPLSGDLDYPALESRILEQLFSEELRRIPASSGFPR